MTDAAQLLYLLGWLIVAAALAFWPRRKSIELNSFDIITLLVQSGRRSGK